MAVRTLSVEPIPVDADPALEGLIVLIDKRRLVRVLANYIDNAAKYAGGATTVLVERTVIPDDPDAAVSDGSDEGLATIRITVEDSGPGVPEGARERVFDRFNRGEQGGSRGGDLGTGLGLALVAEHARLQGGAVWVEPRRDGKSGARFVIELPIVEPSPLQEGEVSLDEVTSEHMALHIGIDEFP